MRSPVLHLLALASGLAALGYEVLYVRHLTTLLGDMLYVHASLLSTFLVGVGLGSVWAHRGRRWLWALELGTGLYALLLPTLTGWLAGQPVLAAVTGSPLPTIAATVALTALPAVMIGFSLPLFAEYLKAARPEGSAFRSLYAVYNLGAFAGILLAELMLVRSLGIRGSLAALGFVNIAVGVALLTNHVDREIFAKAPHRRFAPAAEAALIMGSFASAAFQMHLLQTVYLVFGPHRENFAVGLAVILAGMALGAPAATALKLRLHHALFLVAALVPLIYSLHGPIAELYQTTAAEGTLPHRLIFTSIYGLGPMTLFGAMVPALITEERNLARDSGRLLWLSGWANAAGYLAYVLILHPTLPGSLFLASVGLLPLLGGFLMIARSRITLAGAATYGVAVLALTLGFSDSRFYLSQWPSNALQSEAVEIFKRGGESATLVTSLDGGEWITYNGHPSIVVSRDGAPNAAELMSGVIPALAAPTLERGLVLGLGTGITAGSMATLFRETDVVEINEAFIDMMPRLTHVNSGLSTNTGARIYHGDGRTFLNGLEGTYDAILNSIPTPTYYSASKIYTAEFYERVRSALKDGGVFSTWISSTDFTEEGLYTVLETIENHFAACDLRVMRGDYMMATCSDRPLRRRGVDELHGAEALLSVLKLGLRSSDLTEFMDDVLLSENVFAGDFPRGNAPNTDDSPKLEFLLSKRGAPAGPILIEKPARFAIDWERLELVSNPARYARRARSIRLVAPGAFNRRLAPVITAHSALAEAWRTMALGIR